MGISSLTSTQNLVWHSRLMKLQFGQHTFQHCSNTFKLKKCAKCLNLVKTINQRGWNWTEASWCTPNQSAYSIIASVFSHCFFSSASETWNGYCSILPHGILLAMLLCLGDYKQRCTQLLKVLHECCNMDILSLYVMSIYLSNPSLVCCNILMYYIHICIMVHRRIKGYCQCYKSFVTQLTTQLCSN